MAKGTEYNINMSAAPEEVEPTVPAEEVPSEEQTTTGSQTPTEGQAQGSTEDAMQTAMSDMQTTENLRSTEQVEEFTGHAAGADGFYTTVEEFQSAYNADTYAMAASNLDYTARENGSGLYDGIQSVVAMTGNVSKLIDNAQASMNGPTWLNGLIDTAQMVVGTIRENFYELLEAQQQYGFGKGLAVWFSAKAMHGESNIIDAIEHGAADKIQEHNLREEEEVFNLNIAGGQELAQQGITYNNEIDPVDVLVGQMELTNADNHDISDNLSQTVGNWVFLSSGGGKAFLVSNSYGFDSAEASRQRRDMLEEYDRVVQNCAGDEGWDAICGRMAQGWGLATMSGYAVADMANSVWNGNGLYGNLEDATNAELERSDEYLSNHIQGVILGDAINRGLSIAEARNIMAQNLYGEHGDDGSIARTGLLDGTDEMDMDDRIDDTDDHYNTHVNAGIDDNGLFTHEMSVSERQRYAHILYSENGILSPVLDSFMQQYGCTREQAISFADEIYQLNVRFNEDGEMYCISETDRLLELYPELRENEAFRDYANLSTAGNNSRVDAITDWMARLAMDEVSYDELIQAGVSPEDAERYARNTGKLYTSDVDKNLDRRGYFEQQEQNQDALEEDMAAAPEGGGTWFDNIIDNTRDMINEHRDNCQNNNIPATVSEDYDEPDTSNENEYGG